jgi:glycosyltransferase involved in cell wall biosynthesis
MSDHLDHPASRGPAVVFTTMNSMRTIGRAMESVQTLASRVVVVDSGSSDGTVEHCRSLGAEVVHRDWSGYATQKQFAIDLVADAEWILLLDSDESLTPELREEIREFVQDADPAIAGAWLKRRHWYKGGWIRAEFPDWQLRLFRRGRGRMSDAVVHERVLVDGRTCRLWNLMRHDSWVDLEDALTRSLRYARLSARIPGRRTSLPQILLNGPWAFIRSYMLQGGILDGRRGFEIALVEATSTIFKHLYVDERPGRGDRHRGVPMG